MGLAIVIPAYKSRFFKDSLASLANQTNKNFRVYIGDDNSPEDLKQIVGLFKKELDIVYVKFDNNIGAKELVRQWNRCVSLVNEEKWIWLFSDDDIADANCVEIFYETIANDSSQFDVYRFDTRVIDDNGSLVVESPESPLIDNAENMAFEILMGRRGNSMPDHIFSRDRYNEMGGFFYTDYAQAADWATSISFSEKKGIKTMQGAKVNWRTGHYNISGNTHREKHKKLRGHLQFLIWMFNFFKARKTVQSLDEIKKALDYNLRSVLNYHYKGIDYSNLFSVINFYLIVENSISSGLRKTIGLYMDLKILPMVRKMKKKIFNV